MMRGADLERRDGTRDGGRDRGNQGSDLKL